MSVDLAVWADREFDLPAQLPNAADWKLYEIPLGPHGVATNHAFETDRWQVTVTTPADSTNEPRSDAIDSRFAHVAHVTLEPIGAPPDGYELLETVVRKLCRDAEGVWIGPDGRVYNADAGELST